jgi:hypothetical protein
MPIEPQGVQKVSRIAASRVTFLFFAKKANPRPRKSGLLIGSFLDVSLMLAKYQQSTVVLAAPRRGALLPGA